MRLAGAMDSVEEEEDSLVVAQDVGDDIDGDEVVGDGRGAREDEARAWRFIGGGAEESVAEIWMILCEFG